MDLYSLPKYALEHELKIRGVEGLTTVEEMRPALKQFFKLEGTGKIFSISSPGKKKFNVSEELDLAKEKIEELESKIKSGLKTRPEIRRAETILTHFARRLGRLSPNNQLEMAAKEAWQRKVMDLLAKSTEVELGNEESEEALANEESEEALANEESEEALADAPRVGTSQAQENPAEK